MESYQKELKHLKLREDIKLIICPSFLYLYMFQNEKYDLGSQDVSEYLEGAHTGEITASQLESMNVKYALVGHSERRQKFKEEESTIINKIKKSYHSHVKPIYFIGETKQEKDKNKTKGVLRKQLRNIINEVPDYKREKLIIVYEPIWSIGSGTTPTNEEIEKRTKYIKDFLKTMYKLELPVLYGGSVNVNNIDILNDLTTIDGFVIGESSHNIYELKTIYNKI
jgi:triosephosphate isomerase